MLPRTATAFLLALLITLGVWHYASSLSSEIQVSNKAGHQNLQRINDLILKGDLGPEELHVPTEQEKLDTIKSALSKLPTEELSRLGIDLHQEFVAGTPNGNLLHEIWNIRQAEMKKAVEGMMKPAEFMKDIINILQNTTEDSLRIQNLVVLESLLADVDNSRDFHTIGGWPVILQLLQSNNSLEIRSHASWCIGTAVKNDYDYQLWILEKVTTPSGPCSGLSLLVENLQGAVNHLINGNENSVSLKPLQSSYDLTKRVLYALSSALRGNMDVQEKMLAHSGFPRLLHQLLIHTLGGEGSQIELPSNLNQIGILRKVWSLISDMIDEVVYLRDGLISEILLQRQTQGTGTQLDDSLESNIKEATKYIHPLGDIFLEVEGSEVDWFLLTSSILRKMTDGCVLVEQIASIEQPVMSPTPSSAVPVESIGNLVFNESCVIFTSSSMRSIYQSVANSYLIMSRYLSQTPIVDQELSLRLRAITTHPTMLE